MLPRALELRAMSEYWLGRHEAATSSCREGLRVARAAGQHTSVGVHLGLLAVLAAVRSDRDTSLGHVAELGDAAVPGSRPHALAQWALALLDLAEARYADAADRLAALARPVPGAVRCSSVMATPHLVEAAHDGRHARASARSLSSTGHACWPRGSTEAEQHFRAALSLHPIDAATFERRAPSCSSAGNFAAPAAPGRPAITCTGPGRPSSCSVRRRGPGRRQWNCARRGSPSARRTHTPCGCSPASNCGSPTWSPPAPPTGKWPGRCSCPPEPSTITCTTSTIGSASGPAPSWPARWVDVPKPIFNRFMTGVRIS